MCSSPTPASTGLVLHIALRGVNQKGTVLSAAAGEDWDALVARSVDAGLAGIECLSGIPGTVGGTPVQNVGAYGQEVSRTIRMVRAFDRTTAQMGRSRQRRLRLRLSPQPLQSRRGPRPLHRQPRHLCSLKQNVPAAVTYADLKHYFKNQEHR